MGLFSRALHPRGRHGKFIRRGIGSNKDIHKQALKLDRRGLKKKSKKQVFRQVNRRVKSAKTPAQKNKVTRRPLPAAFLAHQKKGKKKKSKK